MDIIRKRRSVRNFLEKPVEEQKIDNILRAGMQAPSAHNFQPWEFLIVRDPKMRKQIADLSIYGKPAEKCDTCIVALANMDNVARENRWWQQDMGACVENMLLQTVEEGLGAVWLGYYPEKEPESIERYDAARIHYEKY